MMDFKEGSVRIHIVLYSRTKFLNHESNTLDILEELTELEK